MERPPYLISWFGRKLVKAIPEASSQSADKGQKQTVDAVLVSPDP